MIKKRVVYMTKKKGTVTFYIIRPFHQRINEHDSIEINGGVQLGKYQGLSILIYICRKILRIYLYANKKRLKHMIKKCHSDILHIMTFPAMLKRIR